MKPMIKLTVDSHEVENLSKLLLSASVPMDGLPAEADLVYYAGDQKHTVFLRSPFELWAGNVVVRGTLSPHDMHISFVDDKGEEMKGGRIQAITIEAHRKERAMWTISTGFDTIAFDLNTLAQTTV